MRASSAYPPRAPWLPGFASPAHWVADTVAVPELEPRCLEGAALNVFAGVPFHAFQEVPVIDQMEGGLLDRRDATQDRMIAAVGALQIIGGTEARQAVEKLQEKKMVPKRVKDACISALRRWKG